MIYKFFYIWILVIFLFSGCSDIPSFEEIDKDISLLENEIKEAEDNLKDYSGGLINVLINLRVETLKATKAMLEQKKTGLKRYIPVSYSVNGIEYLPPENKNELLKELEQEIANLKNDLFEAKKESDKYIGGLIKALSLTQVATIKNSLAFIEQRYLLLKHDIPYYSILPASSDNKESGFKPTPGKDIDKF